MASLDELISKPLHDMSSEELQEHLRTIRRNRRAPVIKVKTPRKKSTEPSTKDMSPEEARELLKLLGGNLDV